MALDYIHYSPFNYLKYGITRKEPQQNISTQAYEAFNAQVSSIKARISSLSTNTAKQEIEDRLNFFFSDNDLSKEDQELMDAAVELLEEKYETSLDELNRRTGDIANRSIPEMEKMLRNAKKHDEHAIKTALDQTDQYLSVIYGRMKIIDRALDLLAQRVGTENNTYKGLQDKINKLQEMLNEILTNEGVVSTVIKSKNVSKRLRHSSTGGLRLSLDTINSKTNEKGENFITIINQLLKNATLFPVISYSKQKGDYFEFMIAAALGQMSNLGKDAIKEEIKKLASSEQNKKAVTIEFSEFFNKNLPLSELSSYAKGYSKNKEGILVSNLASEGKLDVSVEFGGQPALISAKNYNMYSSGNISLVDGTSLLYLLQDENSDFVNHYANIISANKSSGNSIIASGMRTKGYYATAVTVLYKAITGDTYGREDQKAELFVVNNNKRGKGKTGVKVFDIKEILTNIIDNTNMLNSVSIKANDTNLRDLTISNDQVAGKKYYDQNAANRRSANYQGKMMRQKLHAGIKKTFIKNM